MATWVDGVLERGLPGDDEGLTRGVTVFDTLRTYGRAPFRMGAHLDRLEHSAAMAGVPWPGRAALEADVAAAMAPDHWIRLTLTLGGHRVVTAEPIEAAKVGGPVTLARVQWPKIPGMPEAAKHGFRAPWVLAARAAGTDEILLVRDGRVLEANRSSVFAVLGGRLLTPPLTGEQLPSVTRQAMLDAGRAAGLPVAEEAVPSEADFEELYLCSTLKELAPVASLDGVAIGGGPLGAALHEAFRALVARECGGR
jgi:branched-chain amino acid aminotransferase